MLEILAWEDIEKVEDKAVKQYLYDTRERAEKDQAPWNFKEWGYWVVIETKEELEKDLKGSMFTLPSIKRGLLDNMVLYEQKYNVNELLVMIDNDFGISFLVKNEYLNTFELEAIKTFKSFSAETTTEKN